MLHPLFIDHPIPNKPLGQGLRDPRIVQFLAAYPLEINSDRHPVLGMNNDRQKRQDDQKAESKHTFYIYMYQPGKCLQANFSMLY